MKKTISLLVLTIMLASCAYNMKSPNNYRLTGASEIKSPLKPTSRTLLISMPLAAPGYQNNNMVYITKNYDAEAFVRNEWDAPPANMLLAVEAESLQNTGYFHAVIPAPSPARSDLRLDTYLIKLQQDFSRSPSVLEMSIGAVLIDSDWFNVIASQRFSVEVTTTSDDPYGGVIAANIACKKLMEELSQWTIQNSAAYHGKK